MTLKEIVKFIRDHRIRYTWKGKPDFSEGDYEKSYYNRREQLLPNSQKFHDEETEWWVEQVLKLKGIHMNASDTLEHLNPEVAADPDVREALRLLESGQLPVVQREPSADDAAVNVGEEKEVIAQVQDF